MSSLTIPIQTSSITISLLASAGLAGISLFNIPQLQAQPASRSLPASWLFSKGMYIFPPAVCISTAGFTYLAISALPQGRTAIQLLQLGANGPRANAYLAAAALNFAIGPFTLIAMIPTTYSKLFELNEQKGGATSEKSARERDLVATQSTEEQSVDSKGSASESKYLSGPQTRTKTEPTPEEDAYVRSLLGKWGRLNAIRALLGGAGGVVALAAALM